MSVGPITYLEVQAFRAETLSDLTAWEVMLIMRIDIAVRNVFADQAPKKPGAQETPEVDVNDRKGIRGLLRGIGERINGKK